MWTKFLDQNKGSLKADETLINKFHDFYKEEVEKIVQSEDNVLQGKQDEAIKIACISFVFENVPIIRMLW